MTTPIRDPKNGNIPTTIQIKDSSSASSEAAIMFSPSQTESAVSPLRSEPIDNITERYDEHTLLKSIQKRAQRQSGAELIPDPPAHTRRLSEFANDYDDDVVRDQKIVLVHAEMVMAEPVKHIETKDVEILHTSDSVEAFVSPKDETSRNEGQSFVFETDHDNVDAMNEVKVQKLVERYGSEAEALAALEAEAERWATIEAEATAAARVAQEMLAALENDAAEKANAAEQAIIRARRALEDMRNTKTTQPIDAIAANIAATIAMAEQERSPESLKQPTALGMDGRERCPADDSTENGSIPNEISSQMSVDDAIKIPDPPIIVRRIELPSESLLDPPDDVSEFSCLPPPQQEFREESEIALDNGGLQTDEAAEGAVGLDVQKIEGTDQKQTIKKGKNISINVPKSFDFSNEEAVMILMNAAEQIVQSKSQDSTPPRDDIMPSTVPVTPRRAAKNHVAGRIYQNDAAERLQHDEKKKKTKPTPEAVMASGRPSHKSTDNTGSPRVEPSKSSNVPMQVRTGSETSFAPSSAGNSSQGRSDEEPWMSPLASNTINLDSNTLDTIYDKIDQCRATLSDPTTSLSKQMASIELMEKLAKAAVSFKALENLDP